MRKVEKIVCLILASMILPWANGLASEHTKTPINIRASYGGELGYQAPLWVAHDLNFFAKQGINTELIRIAGGSRSMATLLSNATQVSQSSAVSPIRVSLKKGDLVIIATSTNRAAVSIIAQPKRVKTPQDLIGKKVGLVGRGDMNEFFFLKALEQWGVDHRKVTFIAVPGSQPRLAALVAGTIHATVLAPPFTFEAEKYGFEVLADFGTSKQAFPQSCLVVRQEFLRDNRNTLKRFLMAYVEAIHVIKTDAPRTIAIMKKYMRVTDDTIARRSYDYYSKLFSQPPLTEEKGIDVVLKFLATQPNAANAKSAKAQEFFDNSLLRELEDDGFLARFK